MNQLKRPFEFEDTRIFIDCTGEIRSCRKASFAAYRRASSNWRIWPLVDFSGSPASDSKTKRARFKFDRVLYRFSGMLMDSLIRRETVEEVLQIRRITVRRLNYALHQRRAGVFRSSSAISKISSSSLKLFTQPTESGHLFEAILQIR